MKFKIIFACLFMLIFCLKTSGQNKVDKYCSVQISNIKVMSVKTRATINFGDYESLFSFKDTTVIAKLQIVNSFTNSVDVLNYMSSIGWTVVPLTSVKYFGGDIERLYFKKTFDSSELLSKD